MNSIVFKNLRVYCPVLVKLGGELYKITCYIGARQAGILLTGKEAMQSMPKFMEHGGHIIKADQCGLTAGRLGEIADIENNRFCAQQF
ncbi:hypothetical protein D3C87_1479450 [compost metagenome]